MDRVATLKSPNRVTAAEIAGRAGLAKSTVANILCGRGDHLRISADTQKRVFAVAEEMGYRPDAAARAMRTGRHNNVALVQPYVNTHYPPPLLEGLMGELDTLRIHLSLAHVPDEVLLSQGYLPRIIEELTVDGLLMNFISDAPELILDAVTRYRIPVVWINNKRDSDCVHPDDIAAGRLAATELLARGHTDIAFVLPSRSGEWGDHHYSVADRIAGARSAMRDAGLELRVEYLGETFADRLGGACALLTAANRPTATIAYGTATAIPLAIAAAQSGVRIPADLSLIMFHYATDHETGHSIAVVDTRLKEVGLQAARRLMEKITNPDEPLSPVAVLPAFHVGETVAAAPQK